MSDADIALAAAEAAAAAATTAGAAVLAATEQAQEAAAQRVAVLADVPAEVLAALPAALLDDPTLGPIVQTAVEDKAAGLDLITADDPRAPRFTTIRSWLYPTWVGAIVGASGRAWMGFLEDGFVEASKLRVTRMFEAAGATMKTVPKNIFGDVWAWGGPGRAWLVGRKDGSTWIKAAADSIIPAELLATTEVGDARGSQATLDIRLDHQLDEYGAPKDYLYRPDRIRWAPMKQRRLKYGDTPTKHIFGLVGDSFTHNATRWSGTFWKAMKNTYGDGGVGWVGFSYTALTTLRNGSVRDDTTVATSGTWTPNYYGTRSPDLGELASSEVGATVTVTFPAGQNSCKLFYIIAAGATCDAQFNGGGAVQHLDLSTGGAAGDLGIMTLTAPSGVATTLTLTVTAGTVTLCGTDIRSATDGVIVHKLAATGSRAQQWALASATSSWRAGIAALGINDLYFMHGTNDQGSSRTTAQFAADVDTFFVGADAALGVLAYDRVIIMPPENQRGLTPTIAEYAAAVLPVADAKDAAYRNLQQLFGSAAADYDDASARPWFNIDNTHPDPPTGGRLIAEAVLQLTEHR